MVKKTVTIAIIAIISFVLLEITLEVAGWTITSYQSWKNPSVNLQDSDEYRIVTLGESTTALFWSGGRDNAWPNQLENKLNSANLGRHFKVFNLARGGISTPFLIESFEQRIEDLHPQLVISMMGVNDSVQFEYSHTVGWRSLRIVKVWKWLQQSRASTNPTKDPDLIGQIYRDVDDLMSEPLLEASPEQIHKTYEAVRKYAATKKQDGFYALEHAAWGFFVPAQRAQIEHHVNSHIANRLGTLSYNLAKDALRIQPNNATIAVCLTYASALAHREPEALDLIHKSMDLGLKPSPTLFTVLGVLKANDDPQMKEAMSESGFYINEKKPYFQVTMENYRRLFDLSRKHHFHYMAMQYPTAKISALINVFSTQPKFTETFGDSLNSNFPNAKLESKYEDILFVSNENFVQAVAQSSYDDYFTDRFSAVLGGHFGHTTPKGHALIAENLSQAIVKNWSILSK